MKNPTISFIVVAYEEADRLALCLSAIRRQLYPYYEIVVSDDGSPTSATKEVADAYNAHFVTHPRSQLGGIPVRNIPVVANQGTDCASGGLLCFLQADHIIQPDYALWLARCIGSDDIMFGLMDRRDDIAEDDLDALVRNIHLPDGAIRYDMFLNQGRRLLVEFDDWRLTDGFDFAMHRDRWIPMDERYIGPSHAILDAMLNYRMNGLHYVLNPLMRLWHLEHPSREPAELPAMMDASYKQMQEKWGEEVWTSLMIPKLYDFRQVKKAMQEKIK